MDRLIRRIVRKYETNCPFTLADHHGITVMRADLGKITRGFFHRRLRQNYIVLHNRLNYRQQRFTCAHELGHYFFDRGHSYFLIEQNTLMIPGKFEKRANQFAAKLLSHEQPLQSGESIKEYCTRTGVPVEMFDLIHSD